jgi:hypothetical protein
MRRPAGMTLAAELAPAKIDFAVVERLHHGDLPADALDHHHAVRRTALDGPLTLPVESAVDVERTPSRGVHCAGLAASHSRPSGSHIDHRNAQRVPREAHTVIDVMAAATDVASAKKADVAVTAVRWREGELNLSLFGR